MTRQSFLLATGDNEAVTSAQAAVVTYDPIARTVTLRGQRQPWLEPGRLYKVIVTAVGENEIGGLQAIDGATLAPGQRRRFEFFATKPTGTAYAEPRVDFCTEVLPILAAKCGTGACHGEGGAAAMGLVLTTPEGIARTAIGHVARETETTGRSAPESEGRLFGVAMPRIAPGSPGSSWLLYKTELARPPAQPFEPTTSCEPPPGRERPAPSRFAPQLPVAREADPIERAALEALMRGRPMPYPTGAASYATAPLTFDERQLLRLWIAQLAPGSALPACGTCAPKP